MKKKWRWLILVLIPVLFLGGCGLVIWSAMGGEERQGPEHYQYTYDVVKNWNMHAMPDSHRDDLFGYGEYLYNSYMALFPRQTPSTLEEYYFCWNRAMDADFWGVYFTCMLSPENYEAFAEGLATFSVTTNTGTVSPILDTEHFAYPAWILQWLDVGSKWEVLEYVMLDEANCTVIFVYTMNSLEMVEEHSAYAVTPTTMEILPPECIRTDYQGMMGQQGFSIYEHFPDASYDLSFLEFLK